MVKILYKITLDLKKDKVHGWEKAQSARDIVDYVDRNLKGEIPPAIEVVERDGVYQLVYGKRSPIFRSNYNYGGHHRSLAAHISEKPLDAFVLDEHKVNPSSENFSSIQNVDLSFWIGDFLYIRKRLKRFPEEVRLRFMNSCGLFLKMGLMAS